MVCYHFWMDVLVRRRDNGELTTSVFKKTTNTLQMLSFNSNRPQAHKRSCVKTLSKRAEKPKKENPKLVHKKICGEHQPWKDRAYGKQSPIWPTSQQQPPVSSSPTDSELPIVQQEHYAAG